MTGWEIGKEYLYEYGGLLVTSLKDAQHQSGAVQIVGKLTVQSIDEETLMLKVRVLISLWKSSFNEEF